MPTEQTGPRKNITLRKSNKKHLSLSQMFPHLYHQSWVFDDVRTTVTSMKLPCVTWPFSTCSEDTRKDTSNCTVFLDPRNLEIGILLNVLKKEIYLVIPGRTAAGFYLNSVASNTEELHDRAEGGSVLKPHRNLTEPVPLHRTPDLHSQHCS